MLSGKKSKWQRGERNLGIPRFGREDLREGQIAPRARALLAISIIDKIIVIYRKLRVKATLVDQGLAAQVL